ncbi:sigma-70 family RNA polymerase sigma factor [bacterium]|nr:sigma-70 family RNA polymerase sigma factor [bacterium]
MSLNNKSAAIKFNIKDYMQLIETVVKVEIKKFNVPHLIEYSELINIGIQVIHTLAKTSNMEAFNSSYLSTAIKWAIRNEIRRRYKWYTLKTKAVKLDEDNQNEIREAVYKTILSVDELADAENPTIIKDEKRTPAENAELAELRAVLKVAIDKLPPREKELVESKFFRDKKLREISEEYGISQSRVSRIIQSGLNKLKRELQKQNFEE